MSPSQSRRYDAVKRGMDIMVGSIGIVLTVPIQLAIGGLVLWKHGSPVLFRQLRPGRNGKVFELVKFRTMKHQTAELVTDAQRLTKFGRLLRSTSLDELPTLWNVVKGDMSLVGPRPLLVKYLERYTPEQARRHEVRPGVTGLAQARGRNDLTWEERFELDLEYVETRSLAVDLCILGSTVVAVIKRNGINQGGHATMPEFTGSADREEL